MKKLLIVILTILVIGLIAFIVLPVIKNINTEEAKTGKEEIIIKLKEYKKEIDREQIKEKKTLEVGSDILGEEINEYLQYFNKDKVTIDVEKTENLIILSPYTDTLETQKVYYKDEKLVVFEYVSNTLGGEVTYYFNNNELIKCEVNYEENIEYTQLNSEKLIERSKRIYNNFFKIIDNTYTIETEKIEESIIEDNGITVLKRVYEYPVITGKEEIILKINNEIKEEVINSFNMGKENYGDKKECVERYYEYINSFDADIKEPFIDEQKYEIKYYKNNILSVYYNRLYNTGGAYPNGESKAITYDMLTGNKVEAYEYLNVEEESMYDVVLASMKEKYKEFSDLYNEIIDENKKYIQYYLTEEGICFFISEHIIGIHAIGELSILIPYEKLK